MASEVKSRGQKVETFIAPSLHKKFKSKVGKNATTMSQVIRDLIQKYVKG